MVVTTFNRSPPKETRKVETIGWDVTPESPQNRAGKVAVSVLATTVFAAWPQPMECFASSWTPKVFVFLLNGAAAGIIAVIGGVGRGGVGLGGGGGGVGRGGEGWGGVGRGGEGWEG